MFYRNCCLGLATALLAAHPSFASTMYDIPSDTGDGWVHPIDSANDGEAIRVGNGGSSPNRQYFNAIYFFELPAAGFSTIDTANLSFLYVDQEGVRYPMNVMGLGYASTPTLDTDWGGFHGVNDTSPGVNIPDRVLLQQDIVAGVPDPDDVPVLVDTDETGDTNLASFLRGLYDNGAQAGDFAIVRLNLVRSLGPNDAGTDGQQVGFAEYGDGSMPARLSFTATPIPEPSAVLLGVLAAFGSTLWRRC